MDRLKHPDLVRPEGPGGPPALVLQEDLDRATTDLAAPLEGVVEAARDRHVGPDLVAVRSHGGQGTTLLL